LVQNLFHLKNLLNQQKLLMILEVLILFLLKSIPLYCLLFFKIINKQIVEKTDKEFGFKFVADNKTYRITVKDLIERGKWVKDINNARTAHLESENE